MGRKLILSTLILAGACFSQVPTVISGAGGGSGGGSGSGVTSVNTVTPLTGGVCTSSCTLGIQQANTTQAGYLSNMDWNTFNNKITNPMTNIGDMVLGGSSGVPQRLPIAASGYILQSSGTVPAWVPFPGILNPLTNTGDILISSSGSTPGRLGIGSIGQVLSVTGSGTLGWQNQSGLTNPMTTLGDLIYGGSGGSPVRLGIGTSGYVLTASSGGPVWSPTFTSPMTTAGDLILGGSSGSPTRLGIGSNGTYLGSNGTTVSWSTPPGFANPMTTIGDLIIGGSSGTPARYAAGTSGYVLTSNGAGVAPTWQPGGSGSGWAIGTSLPGTCTVGQGYFISSNNPNQQLFTCPTANVWTQLGLLGGSGALQYNSTTGALDIVTSVLPTLANAQTYTGVNTFSQQPVIGGNAITALSSGWSKANSSDPLTVTSGNNGHSIINGNTSSGAYFYIASATTSIEAEFSVGPNCSNCTSGAPGYAAGIGLWDGTNFYVVYGYMQFTFSSNVMLNVMNLSEWSYTAGSDPSFSSVFSQLPWMAQTMHLKLSVSGGTLTIAQSFDNGNNFVPLATKTGIGTISKAGIMLNPNTNIDMKYLVVN